MAQMHKQHNTFNRWRGYGYGGDVNNAGRNKNQNFELPVTISNKCMVRGVFLTVNAGICCNLSLGVNCNVWR